MDLRNAYRTPGEQRRNGFESKPISGDFLSENWRDRPAGGASLIAERKHTWALLIVQFLLSYRPLKCGDDRETISMGRSLITRNKRP